MNQEYPYSEFEEVGQLLLSAEFQVAKTMPENPHSYTLRRKWEDQLAFNRVVAFIRKFGYKEKFKGTNYTLLNVNQYKYWTMGWPVVETILINRKLRYKDGPGAPEDAVAAPYDAIAEVYDTLFTDAESLAENAAIMQMLMHGPVWEQTRSILDVGCGTGLLLDYWIPIHYLGLDPSGGMLERLQAQHPGIATLQTTFEEYVGADRFDLIVALFGAASYIQPWALPSVKHLLAPGGSYFMMFYKAGYYPVTYQKTGVSVPHFAYAGNLDGDVSDFGNLQVVRGRA